MRKCWAGSKKPLLSRPQSEGTDRCSPTILTRKAKHHCTSSCTARCAQTSCPARSRAAAACPASASWRPTCASARSPWRPPTASCLQRAISPPNRGAGISCSGSWPCPRRRRRPKRLPCTRKQRRRTAANMISAPTLWITAASRLQPGRGCRAAC